MIHSRKPAAVAIAAASIAVAALCSTAWAADYPTKPIRVILGQPPGGPTDIGARTYADKLRAAIGQPIVVENRPGADTQIAIAALVKSVGDGYTLYYGSNSFSGLRYTSKSFDVDWQNESTPVTVVAALPTAIAVSNSLNVRSLDEFLADIKANPGKRNYASTGSTGEFLTMESFKRAGGLSWTTIPYKGATQSLQGLQAGDVQILYTTLGTLKPLADAGKIRILVVSGDKRSALAPDVPSISEAKDPTLRGLARFGFRGGWQGIIGPAKMPADVVDTLYKASAKIANDPDFKKRMLDLGIDPISTTPAETVQRMKDDDVYWAKMTKELDIKPQ